MYELTYEAGRITGFVLIYGGLILVVIGVLWLLFNFTSIFSAARRGAKNVTARNLGRVTGAVERRAQAAAQSFREGRRAP